jgi:uncharacterized membrane-anchored protein
MLQIPAPFLALQSELSISLGGIIPRLNSCFIRHINPGGLWMPRAFEQDASKVPEVTLVFWIIKIAATTLGETGGDSVTMTLNWGYLVGTAIFFTLLVALVIVQIKAEKFHPFIYWATIVASTTAGTTMADFADRSLGIGYAGGSTFLFVCLMAVLGAWYWALGSISVTTVNTPKAEAFYWLAITFSQTRWERRSAIGWSIIPASGMDAVRWCSAPVWPCWLLSITGQMFRASFCFGLHLS